jgi:DNA-binding CsgD family transcriptional regulator
MRSRNAESISRRVDPPLRDPAADLDASEARATLAALPLALLLVDSAARVSWASPHARRILRAGDPLFVDADGMLAPASARTEIESILSAARRGADAATALARTPPRGRLFVRATRLGEAVDRFLLQLVDRDEPPSIDAAVARQLFAFTIVEARLAALVAEGESLGRAAGTLRISTGTARNHLKSIFRKTGVRRQSDLVRLLLTTSMAWETRR